MVVTKIDGQNDNKFVYIVIGCFVPDLQDVLLQCPMRRVQALN